MTEFITVFINVILPVFGIVALGFLLGGKLELQAQTLTRAAYYVFVPAFIFQSISTSQIPLDDATRMVFFIIVTHLLAALVAGGLGFVLGRSREMIAAFAMIAVFGNVGNYGLAVIRFRLGDGAIAPATVYFVAITVVAFVVCVGAAGWAHGGRGGAIRGLLRTPALWATVPAMFVSNTGIVVPLMLTRMISLLADAMIPVMLFALGLQLLEQKRIEFSLDALLASSIRLIAVPALACLVAIPFRLGQIEYAAGVMQAGMPTAILVAIIAKENNIVPGFVTSVVLLSTIASLITLTVLMVLL